MNLHKYTIYFNMGGVQNSTTVEAVNIVDAIKKFNCSETFPLAVVRQGCEINTGKEK